MIQKILDLHIHSKYSRACSKNLELAPIAETCQVRGIDIVTTGDFTHPRWFESIKQELEEETPGIYKVRGLSGVRTRFLIGTEVASIKKHKDKTRRVHHLLFAPNIEVAEKFNTYLTNRNFNLKADGRPILGLTSKEILQIMLEIDERMIMIPAHAWTPWFGIFGSKGGYDDLEEAYEELTPHIRAIETGLSSDPLMNRRVSKLDSITLISNSDAHSPQKLGREANIFQFENEQEITYSEIIRIIQTGDKKKFPATLEFYPEEGKYHYDGHATCQFSCHPKDTKKYGGVCPKCKKPLVIGVMNRVDELADRDEETVLKEKRVNYKNLVPLVEIIADTLNVGVGSKSVQKEYNNLIEHFGNEFSILLHIPVEEIQKLTTFPLGDAIDRVRKGNIFIQPGYDGIFGVVKVFRNDEKRGVQQMGFEL